MIAVTVGHERFVGLLMHPYIRRAVHVLGVGIALALVAAADLQHELAVLGELQQLVIGNQLEAGKLKAWAIVSA
jgi:hypothetical protein